MSKKSNMKFISIALILIGIALGLWGYQMSGSVGSQFTQVVTGSDTDRVMTIYAASAISIIIGLFLLLKR